MTFWEDMGAGRDAAGSFSDIKGALTELFESYGYLRYRVGRFEEYDVYAKNRSFVTGGAILTFTDTDGRLMAMRPDVTMSIVRNTRPGESLRKLYYFESVYRAKDPAAGFGEIPQAGVECLGKVDLFSVREVIALAAESLGRLSERYILDISHMGVLAGALEDMGVGEGGREELLRLAGEKNSHEGARAAERLGMTRRDFELFDALVHLRGERGDAVLKLEALGLGERAGAAVRELRELSDALSRVRGVYLDLTLRSDPRYYTGLVMKGYVPGVAQAVLSGGRYDGLVRRLHREEGAVGFAVYLGLLERLGTGQTGEEADVLVIDRGADAGELAGYAAALRERGMKVRVDRAAPEGVSFKRTVYFGKEGPEDE